MNEIESPFSNCKAVLKYEIIDDVKYLYYECLDTAITFTTDKLDTINLENYLNKQT